MKQIKNCALCAWHCSQAVCALTFPLSIKNEQANLSGLITWNTVAKQPALLHNKAALRWTDDGTSIIKSQLQLKRSVVGQWPHRPGCYPRQFHLEFVVDTMAHGQAILQVLWFFSLRIFPLILRNRNLSICRWSRFILSNDSVVRRST